VGSSALGAWACGRCFGVAAGRRSRCQSTARQFWQTWTSSLQIDIGAALQTLQKPSRVSVGAGGARRWAHSGVWRCGELAGMSWQRSVPSMCSCKSSLSPSEECDQGRGAADRRQHCEVAGAAGEGRTCGLSSRARQSSPRCLQGVRTALSLPETCPCDHEIAAPISDKRRQLRWQLD
jgi:hypothetical protein